MGSGQLRQERVSSLALFDLASVVLFAFIVSLFLGIGGFAVYVGIVFGCGPPHFKLSVRCLQVC